MGLETGSHLAPVSWLAPSQPADSGRGLSLHPGLPVPFLHRGSPSAYKFCRSMCRTASRVVYKKIEVGLISLPNNSFYTMVWAKLEILLHGADSKM